MDKVRVGVIGLGHNGQAWLEAYLNNSNVSVLAVSDLRKELADDTAKRYNIPKAYYGLDMIEQADLDLISIHTPDPYHYDPFVMALDRKKHVVVEKPMSDSIENIKLMVSAWRKSPNQKALVGHVLRFSPFFRQIKQIIDDGVLGEIFYAEADYIHDLRYQGTPDKFNQAIGMNWYLEREMPMLGGGIHVLDILRWFVGKDIVETFAMSHRLVYPEMKHDASIATLHKFSNGAIAKVTALYAVTSPMMKAYNLALYGTKGTIKGDEICVDPSKGYEPLPIPYGGGHPFDPEVEHIVDCIINDKPTLIDPCDAANSTIPAALSEESARTGKSIIIPIL